MSENLQAVRIRENAEIFEATIFDSPKKFHEGMFIQLIEEEIYPAVTETTEAYVIIKCEIAELTVEPSRIYAYSQPLGETVMYMIEFAPAEAIEAIANTDEIWKKPVKAGDIGKRFGITDGGRGKLLLVDEDERYSGRILDIINIDGGEFVRLEFLKSVDWL